MAGRAIHRILLITAVVFFSYSSSYAEKGEDWRVEPEFSEKETLLMEEVPVDTVLGGDFKNSMDIRFQEVPGSRLSEIMDLLDPDFSLKVSFNNRNLKESFLENNLILGERGFGDQILYSIDFTPSVIFSDRFALEFTYSSIPVQRNFPNSTVLSFESQRIILNEVNGFSGHAIAISSSYTQPIVEGIRATFQLGAARMRLNVEETLQYHPDDPFASNYRIVTLPYRKRVVTYSNPFVGLSAEFQLQSIRLSTGYQLQLYGFDEVSSSNFYISLGVRLSDLY